MTLSELRFIVALAREKNFRKAAEKSFVSQPALSLGIKKIEEELYWVDHLSVNIKTEEYEIFLQKD